MANICRNCGNYIQDGDMFCDKCGTPVGMYAPPKKSHKGLVVGLCVGAAVIITAVILLFVAPGFLVKKDKKDSDEKSTEKTSATSTEDRTGIVNPDNTEVVVFPTTEHSTGSTEQISETTEQTASTEEPTTSVPNTSATTGTLAYGSTETTEEVTTEATTRSTIDVGGVVTTQETTETTTEKTTEKTTESKTEKTTESKTDKTTEESTEKTTEKTTESKTEKTTEKTTESKTDKTTESTTEVSQDDNRPDFEKYGIRTDLPLGGNMDIIGRSTDGYKVDIIGKVSVDSFTRTGVSSEVMAFGKENNIDFSDYEELRVRYHAFFDDTRLYTIGLTILPCSYDYYNIKLYDDSKVEFTDSYDSTYNRFTIKYNDTERYVYRWTNSEWTDYNDYVVYDCEIIYYVPAGYDGIVYGFRDPVHSENNYIYDGYDSADYQLFRLK